MTAEQYTLGILVEEVEVKAIIHLDLSD